MSPIIWFDFRNARMRLDANKDRIGDARMPNRETTDRLFGLQRQPFCLRRDVPAEQLGRSLLFGSDCEWEGMIGKAACCQRQSVDTKV